MSSLFFPQCSDNIRFFRSHKDVFDIDDLYPLRLFERFAEVTEHGVVECSTKIRQGRIYAARFYLEQKPSFIRLAASLDYFRQVGMRADIKLDFRQLEQFLRGYDVSQAGSMLAGVDARREISTTCLKFHLASNSFGRKLQEAIDLSGICHGLDFLRMTDAAIIGFDFHLDGRTAIELYADFDLEGLQLASVRQFLATRLSPNAMRLIKESTRFIIGLSKNNPSNVLYFVPKNSGDFISGLHNGYASHIHAYYRHQTDVFLTFVGCQEAEVAEGYIDNLNLYYRGTKYTKSGCARQGGYS